MPIKYNLPVEYDKLRPWEKRVVRKQYVREQGYKCWHCGGPLQKEAPLEILQKPYSRKLFPKNFFDNPIHLQHNHVTGLTEGAVHSHCNAYLWQYKGR